MYTSSSLTNFFKYYLPLVLVGLFALATILGDFSTEALIPAIPSIVILTSIYLLILVKVRYVSAKNDKLVTETLRYEEEIPYDQINYISQSALTHPVLIRIAYTETESGKLKKFYAIGSTSEQTFNIDPLRLKELALTKYIRRKAKEANPAYDESEEPSRYEIPITGLITISLGFLVVYIIENI